MASSGRVVRGDQWAAPLCQALAQSPTDVVSWMGQHTQLIKSDTYSRVGLLELQQQPCFLKLYLAKSPLQRLGFRFGYGRAAHSFDAANRLHRHGLPVPIPRVCLSLPGAMMLLTEAVADSQDLRTLWLAQPTSNQAEYLMQSAGEMLASLHGEGFAHGDCKWSNLLWNGARFYLVDLDAVREVKSPIGNSPLLNPRQVRDLARFTVDAEALGVRREQYDLFLQSYCTITNYARQPLVAAVASAAEPVRQRHAKQYSRHCDPLV